MDLIKKANEILDSPYPKTTNERIVASRAIKDLNLALFGVYKKENDKSIMDLMKRLTEVKKKIDKRLKGRALE